MPAIYYDGALAFVQTLSGGTWTTRTVPWDNGPDKTLAGTSTKVFGGDSHGYGSSRMNLTSLAGQTVRVVFRVTGDQDTAEYGWWVDDIRAYTCPNAVASVPATTVAAATTSREGDVERAGVRRRQPRRVVPDHPFRRQGEHRAGARRARSRSPGSRPTPT